MHAIQNKQVDEVWRPWPHTGQLCATFKGSLSCPLRAHERGIAWLSDVSKEPSSPGLRCADGDALI